MAGHRFAGELDHVEATFAAVDHAVDGDAVARKEQNPVAGH